VPADKIKVIYNGVDPKRFHPAVPAEAGGHGRPTIVNVGLIFPLKGQLGLIEAAALVRQRVPDVQVLMYGSPSDEEYYQQCRRRVAELNLEETVVFAGPTTEPWTAFQEATVVAMASVSEAFPYAVIEAMLCGAAIVATDTGGVSEAVGDGGVVVPPLDPRRMADALVSLIDDPARRGELGVRATARARANFTQARFLDGYRRAYAGLQPYEAAGAPREVDLDPAPRRLTGKAQPAA
jgi:glycosyltransferase involved in cell wall biosynthesis